MKKALSDAEWALVLDPSNEWAWRVYENESYHSAAALNLHGQPFGFTWDDVERLRTVAMNVEPHWGDEAALNELADRIEALLPPKAP